MAARATLAHAERILPLSTADMFDGGQIRHEYSAALMRAGIELKGGGDKAKAAEILRKFDRMLDTYEKNGGRALRPVRAARRVAGHAGQDARSAGGAEHRLEEGLARVWRARRELFYRGTRDAEVVASFSGWSHAGLAFGHALPDVH